MRAAFIILNYNTYEETKDCVVSIEEKIDTKDYVVIIVDNKSSDDCLTSLNDFVASRVKCVILKNKENLGFAKGNNVGIDYAKKNYDPDYYIVLNSDTELIQNDLISQLDREYINSNFSLLGPLILNADGRCDNSPHAPPKLNNLKKEIKEFKRQRRFIKLNLYKCYCFLNFLKNLKNKVFKKTIPSHRNLDFSKYQQNVVLQGCFLVFTRQAFECIDGFDSSTFLYYEEPLLYLDLIKNNLITVYNPEIVIYHKDGMATKKISKSKKNKMLFINKCYLDSANILYNKLSGMENYDKNKN